MPRCAGIKRDGGRCTVIVPPPQTHCYAHDPSRAEERKRNASRGGWSKGRRGVGEIPDLKSQLEDLAADVLDGKVATGVGAVVNQIINTRLRAIELERKFKETEELEARISALETTKLVLAVS
jgi:hypothetical protein